MSGDDPQALLALAQEAAVEAGAELLERFARGGGGDVSAKSTPTDLVSEADLAAQSSIRRLIEARRADDAFLGEEDGADQAGSSGLQWVVDPLDGTINYLFGLPQWSVSVAVRDAGGVIAAVVHNPAGAETFTALRGGVPERNGVAMANIASACRPLAECLVATGFAYGAAVRRAQGEVVARLLGEVRDIRRFGSAAVDLAWTAMGRYDAYYERGVKAWDIAAGTLICAGVGLEVHELAPRGVLPGGVLVAPAALAGALLAIVG
jgi:myo-inositol-1(or 4)-monophosphatase